MEELFFRDFQFPSPSLLTLLTGQFIKLLAFLSKRWFRFLLLLDESPIL
jgi:hypothetical protein